MFAQQAPVLIGIPARTSCRHCSAAARKQQPSQGPGELQAASPQASGEQAQPFHALPAAMGHRCPAELPREPQLQAGEEENEAAQSRAVSVHTPGLHGNTCRRKPFLSNI